MIVNKVDIYASREDESKMTQANADSTSLLNQSKSNHKKRANMNTPAVEMPEAATFSIGGFKNQITVKTHEVKE